MTAYVAIMLAISAVYGIAFLAGIYFAIRFGVPFLGARAPKQPELIALDGGK